LVIFKAYPTQLLYMELKWQLFPNKIGIEF
jgi:hypothetical protein